MQAGEPARAPVEVGDRKAPEVKEENPQLAALRGSVAAQRKVQDLEHIKEVVKVLAAQSVQGLPALAGAVASSTGQLPDQTLVQATLSRDPAMAQPDPKRQRGPTGLPVPVSVDATRAASASLLDAVTNPLASVLLAKPLLPSYSQQELQRVVALGEAARGLLQPQLATRADGQPELADPSKILRPVLKPDGRSFPPGEHQPMDFYEEDSTVTCLDKSTTAFNFVSREWAQEVVKGLGDVTAADETEWSKCARPPRPPSTDAPLRPAAHAAAHEACAPRPARARRLRRAPVRPQVSCGQLRRAQWEPGAAHQGSGTPSASRPPHRRAARPARAQGARRAARRGVCAALCAG